MAQTGPKNSHQTVDMNWELDLCVCINICIIYIYIYLSVYTYIYVCFEVACVRRRAFKYRDLVRRCNYGCADEAANVGILVLIRQPELQTLHKSRPPNVPLLRALWSLLVGIWAILRGSWGVLVVVPEANNIPFFQVPKFMVLDSQPPNRIPKKGIWHEPTGRALRPKGCQD